MTLFADVLVLAGGVVLGRWIARAIRARRAPPAPTDSAVEQGGDALRDFPCKLGDVILRTMEHDEVWLAGALVFSEEAPIAALFVAPDVGNDRGIFVRPGAGAGIVWLSPLPPGTIARTTEPPHALDIAGTRFERATRHPVRVSRQGTGAPDVGKTAVLLEYRGAASERVIVVAGSDHCFSWRGTVLPDGDYEVLPGQASS